MSNMSYCRFQNTQSDLNDCVGALEGAHDLTQLELSNDEMGAMHTMAQQCQEFLDNYNRLQETA